MPDPVLDTVALRMMAFAVPDGIEIMLHGLGMTRARFPTEVYNRDEDTIPLDEIDDTLSEFARGIRYARRQVRTLPLARAHRYQVWLDNATQIDDHLRRGSLVIEPMLLDELPRREELMHEYGIDRGEAASLVLAGRQESLAIFVSSDNLACQAAQALGIAYRTLPDILVAWARRARPDAGVMDALVRGLRSAKFALHHVDEGRLREQAR